MNHYEQSLKSKSAGLVIEKDHEKMLKKVIQTMTEKYGYQKGLNAITNYMITGNGDYLTRDNNIRKDVLSSNMREEIRKELQSTNQSFGQYVSKLMKQQSILKTEDTQLLEAMKELNEKYGKENGIYYMKGYLATGNNTFLTRDNNLRERITKSNMREEIIKKLKEKQISLEDYITSLDPEMNVSKKNKQV